MAEKKKKKKHINWNLLLAISFLILSILVATVLYVILNKKEPEVIKPDLTYSDFEKGLDFEYDLLNCEITNDSITFYVKGIKDYYYIAVCKNIENLMRFYIENRENSGQTNFTIYSYGNNVKYYQNEEPEAIIHYILYDNFCEVEKIQTIPSIDEADGLLPYEFIEYDGTTLTVKIENAEELSLVELVKQMKALRTIAIDINFFDDLKIKLIDDSGDKNANISQIEYLYDGSNKIRILETREIIIEE